MNSCKPSLIYSSETSYLCRIKPHYQRYIEHINRFKSCWPHHFKNGVSTSHKRRYAIFLCLIMSLYVQACYFPRRKTVVNAFIFSRCRKSVVKKTARLHHTTGLQLYRFIAYKFFQCRACCIELAFSDMCIYSPCCRDVSMPHKALRFELANARRI